MVDSSGIHGTLGVSTFYNDLTLLGLWDRRGGGQRPPPDYDNPWTDGEGTPLLSVDIHDFVGFVYRITNLVDGRAYIGKKLFLHKKRRRVKGRNRIEMKESDWKTYYGSCIPLTEDIEVLGKEKFKREVLWVCTLKRDLTFFEVYEQMINNVLEDPMYYNTNILGKFFLHDPTKSVPFVDNLTCTHRNFVKYYTGPKPSIKGDNNPAKRPEVREKISKRMSGDKHPHFGKKNSPEHQAAILASRARPITDGKKVWNTLKECREELGLSREKVLRKVALGELSWVEKTN